MKIGPKFSAFNIIAKGLRIQKKRMDLVAENIANADTTRTADGGPYKRKFLVVREKDFRLSSNDLNGKTIRLNTSSPDHIPEAEEIEKSGDSPVLSLETKTDETRGEMVYMPDHPDADENGYVEMPNVNIVTEMVDMIAASRGFEANVTAFNGAKQIAKDSLEI
jgi:flagellar basal-body rod protein FlgC